MKALTVKIKLTHTYIGDLVVTLENPTGTKVTLHNRRGGSRNNINATYSKDTSDLAEFFGQPIVGQWSIKIVDKAARDVGKLETLEIEMGW